MSKISTIYGNFETFVTGQLTTYKRIPDAYNLEANAGPIVTKGWGLIMGPATNTNRFIGCKHSTERMISIALTNQVATTEHNLALRKTLELAILEDVYKLRKAIETDPDLQASTVKTNWLEDTGIESLEADRMRFYTIRTTFAVEYIEDN